MHMSHKYASLPPRSTLVLKYGGSAMAGLPGEEVLAEVAALHAQGHGVLLVHGGGPEIDSALAAAGLASERIDGLRVTTEATLAVTEMVLCATINKRLVRALVAAGVRAVGISGEDDGLLRARRSQRYDGKLGFVGEGVACEPRLLHALLAAGIVPVVAPLALSKDATHALNVNADEAAGAVAGAMRAAALLFVTDVARLRAVADDPASAIDRLTVAQARAFLLSDACRDGMRPKVRAAIAAHEAGVKAVYLCASGPEAIARALDDQDATVLA